MSKEKEHTLGKHERLKKKKYIDELFKSGKSFSVYPLRAYYFTRHDTDIDDETPDWKERIMEPILQFGVGVSKKHFKKAVDRNRIKRLIREAYRTQNRTLSEAIIEKKEFCLKLFILYVGNEMPDASLIDQKVEEVLGRLEKKFGW